MPKSYRGDIPNNLQEKYHLQHRHFKIRKILLRYLSAAPWGRAWREMGAGAGHDVCK